MSLTESRPTLITGASGFVGAHLARTLAVSGATSGNIVVGTCTSADRAWRLTAMPTNFFLAVGDVCNPATLEPLFAAHRFGTVFHLAGVHSGSSECVTAVNSTGAFHVAQLALRYGVSRFIHCGSGLEYEPSVTPIDETEPLRASSLYGASKAAGSGLLDYLCRVEGLPLTVVRLFSVFGPGEAETKLIPYVIDKALRREPLHLTSGTQIRDYVYVSDAVEALLLAAGGQERRGEVFNVGSGTRGARTVRSLVETTMDLLGAPKSLCRFGEARRNRLDPPCLVSDPSRAMIRLGWRPRVALEDGLLRTIRSMKGKSLEAAA